MSSYFEAFNPLNQWNKGDRLLLPQVEIRITTSASGGAVTAGSYLATEKEIDDVADRLIKELEAVRKDAKRQLKAMLDKQLRSLES